MEKSKLSLSRSGILIILTATLSIVCVFMNMFTSLRWQFAPGLTFGNVFFTWIPMVVCDILIECYGKKKGIAIPAYIYLVQGLFFLCAAIVVNFHPDWLIWKTSNVGGVVVETFPVAFGDTFRVWGGSVLANYTGFLTNSLIMYGLKKAMKNSNWYAILARALISTMFGQFVDNMVFMSVGLGMDMTAVSTWQSAGWRQLVEVGMELVFFPVIYFLIKKINKLPDPIEELKQLSASHSNNLTQLKEVAAQCLNLETTFNAEKENFIKQHEMDVENISQLKLEDNSSNKLEMQIKEQSSEVRKLKALLKKNNIEIVEKKTTEKKVIKDKK